METAHGHSQTQVWIGTTEAGLGFFLKSPFQMLLRKCQQLLSTVIAIITELEKDSSAEGNSGLY